MLHQIILGLVLAGWTLTAQAQQYPTKPIRVIVSIAAGSVTDVIMRAGWSGIANSAWSTASDRKQWRRLRHTRS